MRNVKKMTSGKVIITLYTTKIKFDYPNVTALIGPRMAAWTDQNLRV